MSGEYVATVLAKILKTKAYKNTDSGYGDYIWEMGSFKGVKYHMLDKNAMSGEATVSICVPYVSY